MVRNCFAVCCFTAVGDDALGVPKNLIKKAQNILFFLLFRLFILVSLYSTRFTLYTVLAFPSGAGSPVTGEVADEV